MKKLLCLLLLPFLLGGCLIYGKGSYVGYVTAVEQGIIWAMVWLKTDLESSDADAFLIQKSDLKTQEKLMEFAENNTKIKVYFLRHIITIALDCNDEIIEYSVLK